MSTVTEWLALLRAHEGGVTVLEGRYFNHGRPVADYLAEAFAALVRTKHLALGPPTPIGQRQVCVTRTGQFRFTELNSNGVRKAREGDR